MKRLTTQWEHVSNHVYKAKTTLCFRRYGS